MAYIRTVCTSRKSSASVISLSIDTIRITDLGFGFFQHKSRHVRPTPSLALGANSFSRRVHIVVGWRRLDDYKETRLPALVAITQSPFSSTNSSTSLLRDMVGPAIQAL